MDHIEKIKIGKKLLALLIKANTKTDNTAFFTQPEANLQVGHVVYPKKTSIKRHIHKTIHRRLDRTEEVLIVKKGKCSIDIYDENKKLITTRELSEGDIIILVSGGHGFQILEDTVLLEIKQGPYTGVVEKERF